jgi:hypothetical protein
MAGGHSDRGSVFYENAITCYYDILFIFQRDSEKMVYFCIAILQRLQRPVNL